MLLIALLNDKINFRVKIGDLLNYLNKNNKNQFKTGSITVSKLVNLIEQLFHAGHQLSTHSDHLCSLF